jgi:sugar phosphate isomerase/epimerase
VAVGISTYCFTWRLQESAPRPLGLLQLIDQTRELGASVLQICDYAPVEHLTATQLQEVSRAAEGYGVALELGTRGVDAGTMRRYLELAQRLGASLVRTMYARFGENVPMEVFEHNLSAAGHDFAKASVRLCLETYEMVPTPFLVQVLQRIANPWLGICLDPANCLAALETPAQVIATAAALVTNVHVKDFAYGRREGGAGFEVTGRRLGDGQLDFRAMLDAIDGRGTDLSLVLEHWLPWQGSEEATCQAEADWTSHGVRSLLDYQSKRAAGDQTGP